MMPVPSLPPSTAEANDLRSECFVLNVGGTRFETTHETLTSVRGSRLEGIAKFKTEHPNYRPQHGDYFFDRHPGAFDAVLQLHRCGSLHLGAGVCGNLLKQELKYWCVDDSGLEMCCWDGYVSSVDRTADFQKLEDKFREKWQFHKEKLNGMPTWKRRATRVWLTLVSPSYSAVSKAFLALSVFFTAASIALVIAESHCWISVPNGNQTQDNITSNTLQSCDYWPIIDRVDVAVYVYFVIELLLRIALAPQKRRFLSSLHVKFDLVCIVAQTMRVFSRNLPENLYYDESVHNGVKWLGMFQLLRVLKLLQHSDMAKVFIYTVLMSLEELLIVLAFVAFFAVSFGCLSYYVEESTFYTISVGCWWALVTLTTVGYGDVAPSTAGGYVVASLCALTGIAVIATTIPVVVGNFNLYYCHVRSRKQWKEKCQRARRSSSFWKQLAPFQKITKGDVVHNRT